MLLLYRTLGLSNTLILPQIALKRGALGNIIANVVSYVLLGIPITYMEIIISQFTRRDCIDIWKIRPCLSHIGYFVQFWQLITFIYNHAMACILLHYIIISAEEPPKFTECGTWARNGCDIIKKNYTAYHRCISSKDSMEECADLFHTYPEYQYSTYILFGGTSGFSVSMSTTVTSFVVIAIVYLNCFKRINSIKWWILPTSIYPIVGYLLLLAGSMRQGGVLEYFTTVMDTEFESFASKFRPTSVVLYTLYSVGVGSGVHSNIGSLGTFRSPCFSNSIIAVAISTVFTTIAIASSAMMACPYAQAYNGNLDPILDHPVSFAFVMMPRMLSEYSARGFWLVLAFSCSFVIGVHSNIVMFYTFLEICAKRNAKVGKYSELFCFVVMFTIFLLTIPTFGAFGKYIYSQFFRRLIITVPLIVTNLEIIVFILCYGCNKFYEDVHFMQGIQPKSYMKFMWVITPFILSYVIVLDLHHIVTTLSCGVELFALSVMALMILIPLLIFVGKLLVAAFQKRFLHELKLDPTWGPQDEVLRRSRTMFTAHAMTKEYMYRQYHLQAGVLARQKMSNMRRNPTEMRAHDA
ncbi:sodium:neurotransmitter symporter family domain-containing protein [Phthorimaea operculella]|nr:sodium:neurotransmitter symporter family domain-containing protein [Phthorimaea operculella]